MTKIYRRPNIYVREGEKNKRDEHNRVRNHGLNFHVTEEEMKLIERRIELSGLSKSTFFIESCLYQKILVKGNIKSFDKIKKRLDELEGKLSSPAAGLREDGGFLCDRPGIPGTLEEGTGL